MKRQDLVFGKVNAHELVKQYGTPLYVYDEDILRQRCRDMRDLLTYEKFRVNYSAKANTNVEILKIACEEGLDVDAMSPGEMFLEEKAGFTADRIMFIGNNVSQEEMKYAVSRGILVSVDSLAQLELLGEVNRGGKACVRINPGIGAGHHEKVVTGGKKAKFGIMIEDIPKALAICEKYEMKLAGLNQHIGSLFLEPDAYVQAAAQMLQIAEQVPGLEMIDFGGGMGIPYRHETENRLDLKRLGAELDKVVKEWAAKNHDITVRIEPGRYVVAESAVILGSVHSVKENYATHFIGTDVGFNVLARPVMYDSYHEVSLAPKRERPVELLHNPAYIVGNICESGDILTHDRPVLETEVGDVLIIHDAGAYGFVMASNYNSRPLPAEVLIQSNGEVRVIRKRQTLEDLYPTV